MYPRLLLARDLLSKEGVIFISIDDNEQANLKLLCDDVFGEENFVACVSWHKNYSSANDSKTFSNVLDYILVYSKTENFKRNLLPRTEKQNHLYKYNSNDNKGYWRSDNLSVRTYSANYDYPITNPNTGKEYNPPKGRSWMTNLDTVHKWIEENRIFFGQDGKGAPQLKRYLAEVQDGVVPITYWGYDDVGHNDEARKEIKELFETPPFDSPKPTRLLKQILYIGTNPNDIILDFFAGSGTTGHAVMQLNAEDGGNRKFILCQIDEPIRTDKPAYQFCVDNNLPPVISSITIERLKRAGERLNRDLSDSKKINQAAPKLDLFNQSNQENHSNQGSDNNQKNHSLDVGFKVFDSQEAPTLKVDETGQISINENETDALSRIYNMIFTVGLDEPTQVPETVVEDCIYKIGHHYYITNSEKITSDDYSNALKNGKVFIDGWTASLNGTLQNYKEDVKIVF
jgi:adenine-specific DNA-methyltransferase